MAINEVFPNPTVQAVYFEIRYPNLFLIEHKIGDLQVQLLDLLPDSSMSFRRQFLVADVPPDASLADLRLQGAEPTPGLKVWQLSSPNRVTVSIQTNLLIIESKFHKTYSQEGHDKFRDVIERVVSTFLSIVPIPTLTRIGLRYVDECPLGAKTNQALSSFINTTFPIERFPLDAALSMQFSAVVKRDATNVRFTEGLKNKSGEQSALILDFDAYQENVPAANYLAVADQLHAAVSNEFETSIREPLVQYMRTPRVAA